MAIKVTRGNVRFNNLNKAHNARYPAMLSESVADIAEIFRSTQDDGSFLSLYTNRRTALMPMQGLRKRDEVDGMHANHASTRAVDIRDQQKRD